MRELLAQRADVILSLSYVYVHSTRLERDTKTGARLIFQNSAFDARAFKKNKFCELALREFYHSEDEKKAKFPEAVSHYLHVERERKELQ